MRTIKFRARHNGEWAYFTLDELRHHNTKVPTWVYEAGESVVFNLWTGLKDKNGKEIYEGDIVKIWNGNNGENDPFIQEVKWSNTGGFLADKVDDGDFIPLLGNEDHEIEIIGNIYQNPELLKEEQK